MFSYSSTNFKVVYNVANYFDIYHLLNVSKWINYINYRKAYRIIQRKEHLTVDGLAKIRPGHLGRPLRLHTYAAAALTKGTKLQENLRD
jgi:hypothetical protein